MEDPDPTFEKVRLSGVCFFLDYFFIWESLCRVPEDINQDASAKSTPAVSPQEWTSPES
jgi:hypothetical protein